MVQEKNAATKRVEALQRERREAQERFQKSIVKTVYGVLEVTPAYNTGGYYDQDIPEKRVLVSPDFATKAEAEEWMDQHEADKGNHLLIAVNHLRERTFRDWTGWWNA